MSGSAAGRGPGIGFTTRASCLLAAGLTAIACGYLLGETDLTRAGCFATALPVIAAVLVHRSRLGIGSSRSVEPARSAGGSRAAVRITLTNRSPLPSGALMLEDGLPPLVTGRARFSLDGMAGRESRTVAYTLPPLPRGRYRAGPLRVRAVDPFGLIDLTRAFEETSEFLVTPRVEHLPGLPPVSFDVGENVGSHSIGARGADDASTRQYRTGDDLRKIHWRSTARTGSLMVRQEERPWQGSVALLVDLRTAGHIHPEAPGTQSGPSSDQAGDEREASSLEWAISAAASIGSAVLAGGRDVAVLDDDVHGRAVHFPSATALVDHYTDARGARSADLTMLAPALRSAARDCTLLAVLGDLDARTLQVLVEARPPGASTPAFALLLDTQTWVPTTARRAPDERWEQRAVTLRRAGWHVVAARRGDSVADCWTRLLIRGSAGRPVAGIGAAR